MSSRLLIVLVLLFGVLARPVVAQSMQAIGTVPGSGITIQVTNVYNGIPPRGYLPLRVSIANTSNSDGRWEVVTQAAEAGGTNDRHFGAQATCAVPAHVTQVFEVLAPLPNTTGRGLPHVSVQLTGPGVTNGNVQFNPVVQDPPPSALSRTVPMTAISAAARGRATCTRVTITSSSDGSTTRTSTTDQPDGSTVQQILVTHPDGSTQTTTINRNPGGVQVGPAQVITTPAKGGGAPAPGGTVNTYTGNVTISSGTLIFRPGAVGGSATPSPTSGSANPAPVSPAPTGPPGASTNPANAPGANGSVAIDSLASLQDSALINSGLLEKTTPKPGDTANTTVVKDPLTGQVVRTTVLKHLDGSTTTFSATPAPVGFNVETVVADASGAKISTNHEILLSPQYMQQALPTDLSQPGPTAQVPTVDALVNSMGKLAVTPPPSLNLASALAPAPGVPGISQGGIIINNGTVTVTGNGVLQGNVTVGSNGSLVINNGGSLVVGGPSVANSNALSLNGTGTLVKTGIGTMTLGGNQIYAASYSGPPPPPPPPPASRGPSPVLRGTNTFSSGGVTYGGIGPPARGFRGGYQVIQRQAGSPIFVGLSSALSQTFGDKIKTYFSTTCVRPIQQSTLDTNPDTTQMSSDWRAYLGFDLLFLTGTDWAAAPAGVRTALAYWVAAGGELRLVADSDGGLNLPPRQGERYGAGFLELFSEDELSNYNFALEHTDPGDRALFSLEYRPASAVPASSPDEIPPGFEKRVFTVSPYILEHFFGFDSTALSGAAAAAQSVVVTGLPGSFAQAGADFPAGSKLNYDLSNDKITIVNTKPNLDRMAALLSSYGAPAGVTVNAGPVVAKTAPTAAAPSPAPVEIKRFADETPHLGNHYLLVAIVILCFGILVGPLNLFWFCTGPRRPHLLWVTPLLAIAASIAIIAFILFAEGIGGRGIYYRITQLVPDGKVAVESEVESAVTGLLTHRDFVLSQPAWVLDYDQAKGNVEWDRGDFMQSGPHFQGDWFVSRREQTLVARSVVPTRAALRVVAGATGQPPVLTSEYNDWMQNLFYMDQDGRYWKVDKISDGKPTPLQPATEDEFKAAWNENLRTAPDWFLTYLRRLAPRPGNFFAQGNGSASALEPEYTGLRWNRFYHLITGPVVQ